MGICLIQDDGEGFLLFWWIGVVDVVGQFEGRDLTAGFGTGVVANVEHCFQVSSQSYSQRVAVVVVVLGSVIVVMSFLKETEPRKVIV